jgi:uncharacterized membrane protein
MNLPNDLHELVRAGVITNETADAIRAHYKAREHASGNRLMIAFGILGGFLVGLGVILIVAHNWDEMPRALKTFFAFLPLVIGQAACGFALWKKSGQPEWTESASAFLVCAVGACLSLVVQIYHIPGELSSFVLTWALLALPLVYAMRSSATSLLVIAGALFYGVAEGYGSAAVFWHWLLLLAVAPHFIGILKDKPGSAFVTLHHWMLIIAVISLLGTFARSNETLMLVAYMNLFGILYLLGSLGLFPDRRNDGIFITFGSVGTVILLIVLSFDDAWTEIAQEHFKNMLTSGEMAATAITGAAAVFLLSKYARRTPSETIRPTPWIFAVFLPLFCIGNAAPDFAAVMTNILALALGTLTIRDGIRRDSLVVLNYGLFVIVALVACRFFDTDLSFVARGIVFLLVGAGFFAVNYHMIKKRRNAREI